MTTRAARLVVCSAAFSAVAAGCVRPSHVEEPIPAAEDEAQRRPFLSPLSLTADPLDDAIVRVVAAGSCTGTLIADDLVLTAHHCIVERDAGGRMLPRDREPSTIRIELGGDHMPWGEVGVREIVSADCGYVQGEGDLAILVLDRKLVGMPTFVPRLESAPVLGESVTPWGFGRCALEQGAVHRQVRDGGFVEAASRGVFTVQASICPGDSGGPVLDARREIVGVVSASVMDGDAATRATSYFARIDRFAVLFSAAKEIAAGASPAELPPFRSCESAAP